MPRPGAVSAPGLLASSETPAFLGLTNRHRGLKLSIDMDWLHNQDARAVWEAWQARKQASHEADQCALASGEKTREQLDRENSAVPDDVAKAPLPWNELLSLEW